MKTCRKCGRPREDGKRCSVCHNAWRRAHKATIAPCIKCGGVERFKNGSCKACQKLRAAKYYLDHRVEIAANGAKYYKNNYEKINIATAKRKADNRELINAQTRKRRKENPERERAKRIKYRLADIESTRNKESVKSHKRRAIKKNAIPKWYGELDNLIIEEATNLCKLREKTTGFKWHVDHIVPLQSKIVCGFHIGCNIQVIPATKNLKKYNSYWPDMP